MPQSSANRTALYYVAESTWGVTPTPPGSTKLKEVRFTGESLAHNKNTVVSNEIRADGQVPDVVEVGVSAQGDTNFELSGQSPMGATAGPYDDFFASLLKSTWVDKASATYSVTFTSGTKTVAATGIGTGLVPGQYIRVAGATNPANNGFLTVVTVSANSITVAEAIVTEGPTASVKVDGSRLRNGLLETSFSIERQFQDLTSGHMHVFNGMEPNTCQMTITADQIVNGRFGWVGSQEAVPASVTVGDGAPTAAAAGDVMNATSNVGQVLEGYPSMTALTTAIQGIQFTVNTNRAGRRAIKSRGAIGIRQGRLVVTGTITAYFENGALLTKMIQHTNSAFSCRIHDRPSDIPNGATMIFTFPRIKFPNGDPNAGAVDTDNMHPLAFQAIRDPVLGITMQIDRFPALT